MNKELFYTDQTSLFLYIIININEYFILIILNYVQIMEFDEIERRRALHQNAMGSPILT